MALFSVNYWLQNRHVPADMVDDFLFPKHEHQTIFWSTNFWINWVNDFLNEVLVILNDIVKLKNLLIWGITKKVSDLFWRKLKFTNNNQWVKQKSEEAFENRHKEHLKQQKNIWDTLLWPHNWLEFPLATDCSSCSEYFRPKMISNINIKKLILQVLSGRSESLFLWCEKRLVGISEPLLVGHRRLVKDSFTKNFEFDD